MADLKISALPASTTPLAGTEVIPLVQSGTTKKVSVANLTVGRAVDTAGGTFTDNQTQGTAAKGINFTANTPLAGMTSQLLNWYEEGTYTPTILGDTNPTITYTTQTGKYTRIGNLMHFSAVISWSALSGGTGTIRIQMPKAANGQQTGFMVGIANGLSTVSLIGAVDNGYDSFYLRDTTTNNGGVLVSGLGSSGTFVISGTYFV